MRRPLRRLEPTRAELALLRRVVAAYRKAGLRVPPLRLVVLESHPRNEGWVAGGTVHVVRRHLTVELLVHEVAHAIADQVVDHARAAHHNRFWALVYGIGYQQAIGH